MFSGYDPETGTYDTASLGVRGRSPSTSAGGGRQHRDGQDAGSGTGRGARSRESERGAGHELGGHGAALEHARGAARRDAAAPATACSRCSSGTTPATPPRWCRRPAASPPETFLEVCEAVTAQQRPRADHGLGLLGRLDPPHGRRAVHPRLGDHPAAAGQHGPARRRHPGAARARQHPGLDRHPDPVQPAARATCRCPRPASTTPSTTTSTSIASPDQKGFWTDADAYTVSLLKAYWGDAATAENDFCFDYLPRLTGDHGTYQTVMDMLDDKVEGYFLLGQNPAVGSAHGQDAAARHGPPEVAGGARPQHDRVGDVLEGRARRSRPASCGTEDIGTEVFFFPAAVPRGEGRHVHPDPADAAVAPQGGRAARRLPQRAAASSSTSAARSASGWPARPLERDRPLLDLTWDYPVDEHGETVRRGGAEGDQRRPPHRREGRPAAVELHRDERPTARPPAAAGSTPASTPTASTRPPGASPAASSPGSPPSGAGRGRRTGASSTTAPRPTPTGKPWSERKAYVWWDEEQRQVDRARRPGLRGRQAAVLPARPEDAAARRRWPATTRSSCRPTARAGSTRRPGCSTARCRRTTSRTSRRSRNPLYRQQANPTRAGVPAHGQPARTRSGDEPRCRGLPVRLHHLPADRAPHRRRDEPLAAVPVRAAAGVLLRGLPRAGPRARASSTAGWATIVTRPDRDRGAGAGHRPDRRRCTVGGRTIHQVGPALPLGRRRRRAWSAATRPTTCSASPSTRTCTSRSRKVASCDIRPGRRPDRPGSAATSSSDYRRRAGHHRRRPATRQRTPEPRSGDATRTPDRRAIDEHPPGPDPADPAARRRLGRTARAQGLLHRHLDLHRLQGLRGGLQGVERHPGGRASTCSAPPTTTPARSAPARGATSRSSSSPSRSGARNRVGRRPSTSACRPAPPAAPATAAGQVGATAPDRPASGPTSAG